MSKKKKVIIGVVAVVILAVIAVGAFFIFYRGNTYGITHGTYAPIEENGKIIDTASEYNFKINENGATYMYVMGKLIMEDGTLYCVFGTTTLDRYEISYDKKTEILTVFMPEIYPDKGEIKEFKFKRKTLFN